DELTELGDRLAAAGLHEEARKVVDRELKRLRQMSTQSAEYHVARTYLEVFAMLPWNRTSEDRLDLKAAREILDRDHYDLKTVRSASSSTSPSARSTRRRVAASCALWGRPGSARRRSARASRRRWGGASPACRWVECGTRRRCAAIAAPTSAPSRAASSTRCSAARRATPC